MSAEEDASAAREKLAGNEQEGAAPSAVVTSVAGAASKRAEPNAELLLEKLREHILEKGGQWDEGWRIEKKQRVGGTSAGTWDAYYFSPAGKRFRSRQEIMKALGLDEASKRLPREEAAQHAAALAGHPDLQPPLAHSDVIVQQLGSIDPRPGYHTANALWPVGLSAVVMDAAAGVFRSEIAEGSTGNPVFRVTLEPLEGDAVVLAEGDNAAAPPPPPPPPQLPGGGLPSDELAVRLRRAAPLGSAWGTHRFGLADVRVLKALEALPGVAELEGFQFVEERGPWDVEAKRLEKELDKRVKSKPRVGKGTMRSSREGVAGKRKPEDDAASPAKKAKPRSGPGGGPSSTGERRKVPPGIEADVARTVWRLVDLVEKEVDKEARRQAKAREREAERAVKAAERLQEKQAARLERRAERAAGGGLPRGRPPALAPDRPEREDTRLADAQTPPPPWLPAGSGVLPAALLAGVIETWEFLGSFREVLALQRVPSLADLEASLADPAAAGGAAEKVAMALVLLVAEETFAAAAAVAAEADPDVRQRDLESAFPVIREDTWADVARRLFALGAAAAMVRAGEGSGGLDPALGPNLGSSPLAALGPAICLQYLAAGPASSDPRASVAALPLGACRTAPGALLARQNAQALAAAERRIPGPAPAAAEQAAVTRACRALLHDIAHAKGPKDAGTGLQSNARVLCFDGLAAAAIARAARPLDLMAVAAHANAGVYAAMEDGLEAFAADIRGVCAVFTAAAHRPKTPLAHRLAERRAPEVAAAVLKVLDAKFSLRLGEARSGSAHSAAGAPAAAQAGAEANGGPPADAKPATVDHLARPFVWPWQGCAACWEEEDTRALLLCDRCDAETHTYCLDPPLRDIPPGEWYCPACIAEVPLLAEELATVDAGPGAFARDDFYRAALLLGRKEYGALAPGERVDVLRLLVRLAEATAAARERLASEDFANKAMRSELYELRSRVKRDKEERLEKERERRKEKEAAAAAGADTRATEPPKMTRAAEAEATEAAAAAAASAADAERIEALGALIAHAASRREPLGYDRHWARYWLLGAFTPGDPGEVFVERRAPATAPREDAPAAAAPPAATAADDSDYDPDEELRIVVDDSDAEGSCRRRRGASAGQGPGATWGRYSGATALDALITWLNPLGGREGPLRSRLIKVRERVPPATVPAAIDSGATAGLPLQPPQLAESAVQQRMEPSAAERRAAEAAAKAEAAAGVAKEVATIEAGLAPEARDVARAGVLRMQRWRQLVETARTPQEAMAALVALETMVVGECLKPAWRLWAHPAPSPDTAGTLGAVRVRLAALRSSLRRAPVHSAAVAAAAAVPQTASVRGAPVPRKKVQQRAAAPAVATGGESTDDSGAESGGLIARRTRGALQSKGQGDTYTSDEALARSLQAKLNGRLSRREASRLGLRAPPGPLAPATRGRAGGSARGSAAASPEPESGPDENGGSESAGDDDEDIQISSDSFSDSGDVDEDEREADAAPAGRKALRERPPPVRATRSRPVPDDSTARGKTRAAATAQAPVQGGLKIRIKAGPAPAKPPALGPAAAAAKRARGALDSNDGDTRVLEGRRRLRKAA
ncbi:hypothetical protein WJX81_007608 [Elliptochloris bilobata]|uniref:PHD-type domain-containing protein n=1 Tax=Elliptochloris bilobata TaxID=381761 RepID=A0AAW1QLD6_9CHLO